MIVRVFYKLDQLIEILSCSPNRSLDKAAKKAGLSHLPFDDMDINDLPKGKGITDKLRGEKGKGVWVDNTVETKREAFDSLNVELDNELDSLNPDAIKALRLQRDKERLKKETWRTRKKT